MAQHNDINNTTDDEMIDDKSNQSDSEILLSKVQRNFSRRSKKLSKNRKNLPTSHDVSSKLDETQRKPVSGNASPSKLKPQVVPRTRKPVVPIRKILTQGSVNSSDDGKENNLSPNTIHNPDHSW